MFGSDGLGYPGVCGAVIYRLGVLIGFAVANPWLVFRELILLAPIFVSGCGLGLTLGTCVSERPALMEKSGVKLSIRLART